MQRHTQTEAELLNLIAEINVDWRDDHYEAFEQLLSAIPDRTSYKRDDIEALLDMDFDAAWTAVRVILDLPKDGFSIALRREMGSHRFERQRTTRTENATSQHSKRSASWKRGPPGPA